MKSFRIVVVVLISVLGVSLSHGQEAETRQSRSSDTTPSKLEGVWSLRLLRLQNSTFAHFNLEFRRDGACIFKIFGGGGGSYKHTGDDVVVNNTGIGSQAVWKAHVNVDNLTLQLFDGLPPCPFYRIGAVESSADPLIGTWRSETCDIPAASLTAVTLKAMVSNATYTFASDGTYHIRYHDDQIARYAVQDGLVSCPTLVMTGAEFRLSAKDGIPRLVGNRSQIFEKQTLGQQLADQYIPGDPSDQNVQIGDEAIAEYKAELNKKQDDVGAIDGLGAILFQMAAQPFDVRKMEESKSYFQRHIQISSQDPEAYDWVGAIDWMLAAGVNAVLRRAYGVAYDANLIENNEAIPAAVRTEYVAKCRSIVDDGIYNLQKAIAIDAGYRDAITYLGLLYRIKADMVETPVERANLLSEANDLGAKVNSMQNASGEGQLAGLSFTPPPSPPTMQRLGSFNDSGLGGLSAPSGGGDVGPFRPGVGGVGFPTCVYCPAPKYSEEAKAAKAEGTVVLTAIIQPDGHATSIEIVKGLGLGLDDKAIEALRDWRFKPAVGPNGKPVPVKLPIEFKFNMGPQTDTPSSSTGTGQSLGNPIPGGTDGQVLALDGGSVGTVSGQVQMLTPTEGVDFSPYLAKMVASVKRNWQALMPKSAQLGDQGRVILQFRIMQNGSVPDSEPQLVSASNKEPLDHAAILSIRASRPFEPLPPAFSGPYIELRVMFFYNLPISVPNPIQK